MKLSNKIVLVTGGTSGIGLEAAKLFREEGATVIIVGQNPDRLQSVARQLGDSVTVLRGDVSKPAAVESIIKQISEKFGRIDVLFANAGMGLASPLEAVTEDQIDRQFDVNFKGVFFAIQKAAPLLAKGGCIIVTTSFLNEVRAWPFYPIGHESSRSFACAVVGRGICPAWHSRERSKSRPDQHAVSRQARTFREATQRSGLGNRESGPASSFRRGRGNRKGGPVPRERRFLLHDRIGTGRRWRPNADLIFSVRHEGSRITRAVGPALATA